MVGGNTDPAEVHTWANKYNTLADALKALNKGRDGEASFDKIQRFDATPAEDDFAYGAMLDGASKGYDWLTNNCWSVIEAGLEAANIRHEGAFYPNAAFSVNERNATTLDFNDVLNGWAE